MNKEERILKYINTADELVFSGKRYYENDFYNDVENLVKENQELKDRIDKAIEYIEIHKRKDEFLELNQWGTRDLLEILKEVEK